MAIIRTGDNERTPQGDKSVGVTETTPMAPKKALTRPLIPKFRMGGSSQVMEKAKEGDGGYALTSPILIRHVQKIVSLCLR